MKSILLLAAVVILAGCQSAPPRVITRTVQVTHTEYVPLDARLLPQVDAPTSPDRVRTNGQLWAAWTHDAAQLGICKPALDAIRALQP